MPRPIENMGEVEVMPRVELESKLMELLDTFEGCEAVEVSKYVTNIGIQVIYTTCS